MDQNFTEISLNSSEKIKSNITYPLSALEAFPEPYQSFIAVLYGGTAFIALIANILAIVILITKKRSSADLRKYLVNLAIADISMAAFSIPFTYSDFMYGFWRFPHFLCPLTHSITICSVCVSIFTLTAIGIERYVAIVYPLKYCWWCESHTTYILILIWSLSILISSPLLYYARTEAMPLIYGEHILYDCKELWEGELNSMIYTSVLFVVTFIIPFIALTFLYGSIGIKTFRHIQPGEAHTNRDRAQQRIKIKVIKMLLTLVSVFLVCWAPLQVFNLILWWDQELRIARTPLHKNLYFGLFFSFHLLSQFHTFLNPFIYCYMSNNFMISDLRSLLDRRLPKSCYETSNQKHRNSYELRQKLSKMGTNSTTKTQFSINSVL